jgi:hypothetical protein
MDHPTGRVGGGGDRRGWGGLVVASGGLETVPVFNTIQNMSFPSPSFFVDYGKRDVMTEFLHRLETEETG